MYNMRKPHIDKEKFKEKLHREPSENSILKGEIKTLKLKMQKARLEKELQDILSGNKRGE